MVSPPVGSLPGIDPAWSQHVEAPTADGARARWHVLDNGAETGAGTMLLVHGNPTWSYLWRHVLAAAPPGWRVIAVDQLGMGYSEDPAGTLDRPRRLEQRIADLGLLVDVLNPTAPVVAVGHDWGGIVVSGWAQTRPDLVRGLILLNTTVHHDFDSGLPGPLRFARVPSLRRLACVDTPAFVAAATALSVPPLPRTVRRAYAAPYRRAADRAFVGQFVADIPADDDHPSRSAWDRVAAGMDALADVPALLLRGARDPVFSEAHLRDLRRRLPHADVHRYEDAGHLLPEDAPRTATDIWDWVGDRVAGGPAPDGDDRGDLRDDSTTAPPPATHAVGTAATPWLALQNRARATPDDLCVAEVRSRRRSSFAELERDIEEVALALREAGVRSGQRVALLVPPGIDLTVCVYACWRLGAVIVVADAGLGLRPMGRALRGAGPDHLIGIPAGIAAVAALGVPGRRFAAGELPGPLRRVLRVHATLADLRRRGAQLRQGGAVPVTPEPSLEADPDAAVLFTSGATGPAKGVVYRLDALRAMIGNVGAIYGLTDADRLVAAFAPFALFGPALGIGAIVPDMDVTAPGTLTATALADSVLAAGATVVFASPAALRGVLATRTRLTPAQRRALASIRVVMSAGAPVPASLLRRLRDELFSAASLHTPYGMTEALPVTDIDLDEIGAAGPGDGVCVGRPLPGVRIAVSPLPPEPHGSDGPLTDAPGITGEICVRAAHVKDRYDQLWATQRASARNPGWHRTGDVGHLDGEGRLWVEGRRVHVVHTAGGPYTPVGLEQRIEALPGVAAAAVVGVGPASTQQVVVVVQPMPGGPRRRGPLAPPALVSAIRRLADVSVAAVLLVEAMPVDIRHQSKIDRARLARWVGRVLAGEGVPAP